MKNQILEKEVTEGLRFLRAILDDDPEPRSIQT